MQIVHIAPNAPYNDYWGYQDNLLPKYQRKLGHNVVVIITNMEFQQGKIVEIPCKEYDLYDGIHVVRLSRKKHKSIVLDNLRSYIPIFDKLVEYKPDFIFFHGLLSDSIFDVIKYKKKHPNCIVVQDNHLDLNNGYNISGIKSKLVRAYYRYKNKLSIQYVEKVYGVTPCRKKYAEDYFKIPKSKTDVLLMGADDEYINFSNKGIIRATIRKELNIKEDDFLIITGGKIDKNKDCIPLMNACTNIKNTWLVVFGEVDDDMKEEFQSIVTNNANIIYIGWIPAHKTYDYFLSSDLAFFIGRHTVLWEQACASKIPCVFQKWSGMEHVNVGGNCIFIDSTAEEIISDTINKLYFTDLYNGLKSIAESNKTDAFLHKEIVKKSIECSILDNIYNEKRK